MGIGNLIRKLMLIGVTFVSVVACNQETSEYKKDKHGKGVTIVAKDVHVIDFEVLSWPVGPRGRFFTTSSGDTVSKGVQMGISFPQLQRDDLEDLIYHRNVDSWIMRVNRRNPEGSSILGMVYIPIVGHGGGREGIRVNPIKKGYADIMYRAASKRSYHHYLCPPFGHSMEIDEISKTAEKKSELRIYVSPDSAERPQGEISVFRNYPELFNGGNELKGTYGMEIALFNSSQMSLKSNWVEVPEFVEVLRERSKELPKFCENWKMPSEPTRGSDLKEDFKWGHERPVKKGVPKF